jgi:DNA (cytosine-5)-methyltransferase 1
MKISAEQQINILNSCINENIELYEALLSHGLTYNDLVYRYYDSNHTLINEFNPYLTPEDFTFKHNQIPCVSFFSGAGGMDLGFKYAGFDHVASVEINELFCETIRLNNPDWYVIGPPESTGNICNKEEIASKLGAVIPHNFEGIFHGGPPCQPFSIAANQRYKKENENFKRNGFDNQEKGNLLFDYIWFITEFRPKVFLIENVPGLETIDEGKQLSYAISTLRSAGYNVFRHKVLNSYEYGVPQSRSRIIIVGTRLDKDFSYPLPDTKIVPCAFALYKDMNGLENHIIRDHKAESILRYMNLRYGERDTLGRVDRLNPSLPSKTIIAGGTKGGGRSHLHPDIPRTLSVRESARLQTFPDSYVFTGPSARQFTQVGNAVPPLLAMKIARSIYQLYE